MMADRYTKLDPEQIKDDSIKVADLDFTTAPSDGQYPRINMPAGTFTGTSVSAGASYTTSFTNASLSSGILTVTHSLGIQYVNFTIYDNNGKMILPDDATATSTSVLTIDLTSYGTLSGTWNIRV